VIACALCVGANPEPYLEATLASIAPVVDVLVVNDNSGLERSANVATLEGSAFARDGRLNLFRHEFRGFDAMRNDAAADLASVAQPDWVLFLDADEVHGAQIASIASSVLPNLAPSVTQLDAYTFHFWGSFRWISDIARRMMFYRFDPRLRWEHAVHEKLVGLSGTSVVLPYVYHHYGNVLPPALLAAKHRRYFEYGNAVPEPVAPEAASASLYIDRAAEVRPFAGHHPANAKPVIEKLEAEFAPFLREVDRGIAERRTFADRLRGGTAAATESLRVALRSLEHPGLYRGPRDAQ
jgi:hypothetical protein